jgi:hypothetical protein
MANLRKQADMVHAIARLFDMMWPLMLLASVRYRAPEALPTPQDAGPARLPRIHRREQMRRRRALWLATVGINTGPRRIHGVKVVAR